MKKLSIALLLCLLAACSFAQVQSSAPTPGTTDSSAAPVAKTSLRQQLQALDLTRDQKMQMREILQNAKANKETINANDSLSQDQKQTQLKKLRKQTFTSFNAILTDEQKEKWKAMRADKKKNKNDHQENQAMQDEINSLPAN
jgi:lipase chaperone LimK